MFRGILLFKDGRNSVIPLPGYIDDNGTEYTPETVTIDNNRLFLKGKTHPPDGYEYHETSVTQFPSEPPKVRKPVPFRSDLH